MKLSEIIKATHTFTNDASDKLTAEDVERAIEGFKNVGPFVINFKARGDDIKSFAVYVGIMRLNFYAGIPVIADESIPSGYFRACMSDGTHRDIKIFKQKIWCKN